ncbi:hypothetical protein JCM8547_006807 [Rhodosporidiobolus lusitaniae]
MAHKLPDEVIHAIVRALAQLAPPSLLVQVALVSPSFRTVVRQLLLRQPQVNSSTDAQALLRQLERTPELVEQARSLIVARGARKRLRTAGKGKKAAEKWMEDFVTEEDLVKLCARLAHLEAVHLREPAFSSLRRRQLSCFSHLSSLTTLAINGRPSSPFNLSTVGQVLLTLPHLHHLALRHIHCFPSALDGLPRPTNALSSFALFSVPGISDEQLYWLLYSSINAESLSSIAFDITPTILPSFLYPVRWAPIRTTDIVVTTAQVGVLEHLPRHCPSLRRFTFRSTEGRLRATRLLSACDILGSVDELVDVSDAPHGLSTRGLARALLRRDERSSARLRRITLTVSKREDKDVDVLKTVCELEGVELNFADVALREGEPWIPERFSSLRAVEA